jgi:ribosomal protein S18 acetylase RimI-like enzyme
VAEFRDATPDDLDAVLALLEARDRAALGTVEVARVHVEHELVRPGVDRLVAVVGGQVVGYGQVGSGHVLAVVAPDRAIGDGLLARLEARARERDFDEVEVTVIPEDAPLAALVRRSGFVHSEDVLRMWRALDADLPSPVWRAGTTVRSYDDRDGLAVHALLDEAYGAWDTAYVPQPHDDWLAFMTQHEEFDPALWFLVERDGDLVACALHWREDRGNGWLKDIVVRADERGNGLATALILHAFRAYAERGVERVGLKVDASNPTGAPQLYARLGFVTDRRFGIWRKRL